MLKFNVNGIEFKTDGNGIIKKAENPIFIGKRISLIYSLTNNHCKTCCKPVKHPYYHYNKQGIPIEHCTDECHKMDNWNLIELLQGDATI